MEADAIRWEEVREADCKTHTDMVKYLERAACVCLMLRLSRRSRLAETFYRGRETEEVLLTSFRLAVCVVRVLSVCVCTGN